MMADIGNWLWMAALLALWIFIGMRTTPAGKGRFRWVLVAALALCTRFLVSWVIFGTHSESTGTDGLLYHKIAIRIMEQLRSGIPAAQSGQDFTWYTSLLGVQYALTGANRYAGAYMNAFYAVLGAQLLLHIGLSLGFGFGKASLVSAIWLFMPNLVIWTSDTRKESVSFLCALLLWRLTLVLLKWQNPVNRKPAFAIPAIGLMLWFSTLLRVYMLVPLGGGLAVTFFLHWRKSRRHQDLLVLVSVLSIILLVGILVLLPGLRHYNPLAEGRTIGGGMKTGSLFHGIMLMIGNHDLPQAINGFFTEPHPFDIWEISDLQGRGFASSVVFVEMLIWYLIMPASAFGMLEATLSENAFLAGLVAFILIYSCINILIAENISDTYYRYRAFIIAPVLLFADPVQTLRRWFPRFRADS